MGQLIVSISGIRGLVGDGLGPEEAFRFGRAYGTHLGGGLRPCSARPEQGRRGGVVVVGRDSRPSGPMMAHALQAGLVAAGCRTVDVGILSTPGVGVMVKHLAAAGGAVITASHNPLPYNGIKLMSPLGMALSRESGAVVAELYRRQAKDPVTTDDEVAGQPVEDAAAVHVERVMATIDAAVIREAGLRVVVDAVNGAGGAEMRMLLERLECRCVGVNEAPTGKFGRGPEPVPENLGALGRRVKKEKAALGLALDPDADRLALVDEQGRPLGEEYTLALSVRYRLTQAKGPVACNLSTSRLMDFVTGEAGVPLIRTPVGELNVAEAIIANGCVIGGEGNGGVIDPRVVHIRDSLAGAGLILEMLSGRRKPLSELAAELPVYTMVKDKVTLGKATPAAVLEAVRKTFADAQADTRDGLHLSWADGWLHVRASNTEPVLRILAESSDAAAAGKRVQAVKAIAEK